MRLVLLLAFSLGTYFLNAQVVTRPAGAYMSLEELKTGHPSEHHAFTVEQRSNSDIFLYGGNDYIIHSHRDTVTVEDVKNKFYAISLGDTIYLNCKKHKLQAWYTILYEDSVYYYYTAASCTSRKSPLFVESDGAILLTVLAGPIAGAIAGGSHSKDRYLYVIDKKSGVEDVITDYYLQYSFAKKDRDILDQYRRDPSKDSVLTRLKYYEILKDKIVRN